MIQRQDVGIDIILPSIRIVDLNWPAACQNKSTCVFAQYILLFISGIWIVWVSIQLFIRKDFRTGFAMFSYY